MEHTKGPWKIKEYSDGSLEIEGDGGAAGICCLFGNFENDKTVYPDACLIEAAPDLLAQLQRMVTYYEPHETRPEAMGKIRDAKKVITKALNMDNNSQLRQRRK